MTLLTKKPPKKTSRVERKGSTEGVNERTRSDWTAALQRNFSRTNNLLWSGVYTAFNTCESPLGETFATHRLFGFKQEEKGKRKETHRPQNWDGAWGTKGWSGQNGRTCSPGCAQGFYSGWRWRRSCFHPPCTGTSPCLISGTATTSGSLATPRCIFRLAPCSPSSSSE